MSDEVICTALDQDWGEERPNILMHPPCECPRCAPVAIDDADDADSSSWLKVPGSKQRFRVEPAPLGEAGKASLG